MLKRAEPRKARWTTRRYVLAAIGVLNVGLGALGVFVPGLPTAIFLLVASWCFAKSFPALERRLLRNRFFAPYMRFVDGDAPLPLRDKVVSIALMWISTAFSIWFLAWKELAPSWVLVVIAVAACVGTVVILRRGASRRGRRTTA